MWQPCTTINGSSHSMALATQFLHDSEMKLMLELEKTVKVEQLYQAYKTTGSTNLPML